MRVGARAGEVAGRSRTVGAGVVLALLSLIAAGCGQELAGQGEIGPSTVEIPVQAADSQPEDRPPRAPPDVPGDGEPAMAREPEPAPQPPETEKQQPLVAERRFKTENGALRVSYDDLDLLKVLNMDPVTADAVDRMPDWLKNLSGKRVVIRGFMYPQFQDEGIPFFVMARDNEICCFGRNPKIYDLIEVTMKKGVTTRYIQNRPFDVVGTFRIHLEQLETGEIVQLYHIDDAIVVEN